MPNVKGPDSEQLEKLVSEHQRNLLRLCYLYLHDAQAAGSGHPQFFRCIRRARAPFFAAVAIEALNPPRILY